MELSMNDDPLFYLKARSVRYYVQFASDLKY